MKHQKSACPSLAWIPALLLHVLLCGCAGSAASYNRERVSHGVEARLGVGLGPVLEAGSVSIPPGIAAADGVTAEEAVAIALWNNAAFNEAIAALGLARADLVQAGLLTNPTFSVLFPLGPKQLEFAAKFPLEALWLLPARTAIAELRCREVAELLVQGGVDLSSQVQSAHAAWSAACQRRAIAGELRSAASELAGLAAARLRAGDASATEERLARAEALQAEMEASRAEKQVAVAAARLEGLIGIHGLAYSPAGPLAGAPAGGLEDVGTLLREALASRPDLRAAELEVEAAGRRAGLARRELLAITGILDANGDGDKGFEAGPGLELTVPLFHWNQGVVERARAELEKAARHYVAVREAIRLQVNVARAEYLEAIAAEKQWREQLLPAHAEALAAAERAVAGGEAPPGDALESRRRLLRGRLEHAGLELAVRQAAAELEQALGRRLDRAAAEVASDAR